MLSVSGNPKLKKTTTKATAAAHGGVVLGEAQLKTSQGRRSSRQKEPPPPVRRSRHMHACSYLLLRRHSTWRSRARQRHVCRRRPVVGIGQQYPHTHCLPNNESRQKAAAVDDPLVVERCMYYFLYVLIRRMYVVQIYMYVQAKTYNIRSRTQKRHASHYYYYSTYIVLPRTQLARACLLGPTACSSPKFENYSCFGYY